ncbi:MAG TPA: hypothetical protein VMD02_00010 [Candidatus Omnitrophota bacterium]|nr:hypothetical protein [Candidatus Omnitrophota bacterium]
MTPPVGDRPFVPAGLAPKPYAPPKGNIGPGYSPDTVSLSPEAKKQIAPGANSVDAIPVPGSKTPDGVGRALGLLSDLFDSTFYDKGGLGEWIREQRTSNPDGKLDFNDIKFRRALARELYGSEVDNWSDSKVKDKITDEAIDYFFGNQDGKLDANDSGTVADLIKRLEFVVPRFKAQAAGGGEKAFAYLSSHEIIIIKSANIPTYMKGIDFAALGKANDRMFNRSLEVTLETYKYLRLRNMITEEEFQAGVEAYAKAKSGNWDDATLPPRFKELMFTSYWGLFKVECGARGLKLPKDELEKDPQLMTALMQGAFQNFVEGHSDKQTPSNITHDLPDSLDRDSIMKAKAERDKQVEGRNAASPDQVPVKK